MRLSHGARRMRAVAAGGGLWGGKVVHLGSGRCCAHNRFRSRQPPGRQLKPR